MPIVSFEETELQDRLPYTLMLSSKPVRIGARIPANRLRAEAIPHAVPLREAGHVSRRRGRRGQKTHRTRLSNTSGV